MKEIFRKTTNSIIFLSSIACIVGFFMIINPSMSVKTIGVIASIYIILQGIVLVIIDLKANKYYIPFDGMLPGILSILIGIILVSKPNIISTIFTIAIGVWIALSSINSIRMAVALKNDDAPWFLLLLLGILDLIVGVIVVFNPFEASISMTVFAGIMIMIHSIINIIDMAVLKHDVKRISNAIEKRLKEI